MFDGKVNLVGASKGQHLKFAIVFKSTGKRKIKIKEKWEFLCKFGFDTIKSIWILV